MKAVSGSGPVPYHPWLFGALALLFLTACATTRLAEEQQPSNVGEDAQPVVLRTLADMLVRLPGVQVTERPGGRISVRVSGTGSFLAGQEPLFVLDGMVVQSGVAGLIDMNPNTIESITVLKNAGETAFYGARGVNGVIVIKTKTGSK